MNSKEQKLIIDYLLSSGEVYALCAPIISNEYFDPEYRNVIQYIKDYSEKYGTTPNFDLVNAKFDLGFAERHLTSAEIKSSCDEIEFFCQQQGLTQAVLMGVDDIENGNFGAMRERINKASAISLQKDMGVEMFDNPEEYLLSLIDTDIYYSTGIQVFDDNLDGGLARKQFTLFSANSGVGKSVMLSNLGANYSIGHGMNVVYISLELPEPMIFKRNAFIMTGVNTKAWKEKIAAISSKIKGIKNDGAGTFRVKRLPTGCTCNDIRSYLKQYELEYKRKPDVIIIDYLDLMRPNEGIKNLSISDQDKLKAEQVSQLLHDYDAIGISASQQNREALKATSPDQSVIAGGMTKVNTVDNFISLVMDSALRAKGEMMAFFLKTRSSDGVGKMVMLSFDAACLRIGDIAGGGMTKLAENIARRKRERQADKAISPTLNEDIGDLPGLTPETTQTPKIDQFMDKVDKSVKMEKNENKREDIVDLEKLTKSKSRVKAKKQTAMDLMEEEERITQYGKGSVEEPVVSDSGKALSKEQEEFIKENDLSRECVEHIMTFMG